MKKLVSSALVCLLVLAGCGRGDQPPRVTINGHTVMVELAQTPEQQALGLGWRESLAADHGMLFIFPTLGTPSFWMKDMRFPIDIIWIQDNVIVEVEPAVPLPATDELLRYIPAEPVNYVLEVNAGWAASHGVRKGDRVRIDLGQL